MYQKLPRCMHIRVYAVLIISSWLLHAETAAKQHAGASPEESALSRWRREKAGKQEAFCEGMEEEEESRRLEEISNKTGRTFGRELVVRWNSEACQNFYQEHWKCKQHRGQKCTLEDLHEGGREYAIAGFDYHGYIANEVVVNHEYQFVYLVVRKCGCSTVMDILLRHFGSSIECPPGHPFRVTGRCTTLGLSDLILDNYFFFTFVRDPVDRFYSSATQALPDEGVTGADCDTIRESLSAILGEMQRTSRVPDEHFETQAKSLSSGTFVGGVPDDWTPTGRVPLDWVELVSNMEEAFPSLLREIERRSGKPVPEVDVSSAFRRSGGSKGYAIRQCRTAELDAFVRHVYAQDVECFGEPIGAGEETEGVTGKSSSTSDPRD